MTQPTASELADLIRSLEPFEGKRTGSLRIGVDEVKLILSALRQVEVMRGALAVADHDLTTTHNLRATDLSPDQMNEALNRGVPLSDLEWMTDNSRGLAAIRQALTGEAPEAPFSADECPTCGSPDPKRHPAVQYGGEVSPCSDAFHALTGEAR